MRKGNHQAGSDPRRSSDTESGDSDSIRDLRLDKPVEIAATFPKAGKLGYACGMDMIKGTITVE